MSDLYLSNIKLLKFKIFDVNEYELLKMKQKFKKNVSSKVK